MCRFFKYFIESLKKIIFYFYLTRLHSYKCLKVESKQKIAIFEFIVALVVSIIDEVVNNNINLKTKAINAKLEINYCLVLRYDRALRRDFNFDNKKEFLKSIFR